MCMYKACFVAAFGSLSCTVKAIHSVYYAHWHTLSCLCPILLSQSTEECCLLLAFHYTTSENHLLPKFWVKIALFWNQKSANLHIKFPKCSGVIYPWTPLQDGVTPSRTYPNPWPCAGCKRRRSSSPQFDRPSHSAVDEKMRV